MVIRQKLFLLKGIRVILDDDRLKRELSEKKYSYITGLSYNANFQKEGVHMKGKKTTIIHLQENKENDIFSRFNHTTRNEIRKTYKMDKMEFRLPDENRNGIYDLYKNFEKSGDRVVRRRSYFKESIFAGVYLKGSLIAALISYPAYPYLRIHAIVSVDKSICPDRRFIGYGTRRLVWELICYARNNSYAWVDLGGVNLTEKEKSGITTFKLAFGGALQNEYTYSYESHLFKCLRFFAKK